MMKSKKEQLSRRAKIVELIKSRPGITSGEIAEKLALDNSTKVSTAISDGARTSVFDNKPRKAPGRPNATKRASAVQPIIVSATTPTSEVGLSGFACAVTNDGSLVLMREGQVQFSLSSTEATTLQSYLVKRAAASVFASMA